MTFPRHVGQVPIFYNYKSSGRPGPKNEVFWAHYTDHTNAPLYPFGHGLSYTSFEYSNLKASYMADKAEIHVSVNGQNTGKRTGEEVVQLYIRDRVASVTRPVKELKGFEKISLEPGIMKTVNFVLTEAEFGFFDNQGQFIVEKGMFDIMVGGSSVGGLATEVEVP